ncbi:hypothetical protein SELMODRAFT_423655 [Selaginella moellendorffii]|uniref:Uncharacterized protein n=1 Tax=Selaginella moellendorffii TaxID=88036 RepID=D8SME4_SELML|nr:hypothetical protein SELMODRAFT_423655 [Selaginella moellendorffii]
MNITEVKEQGDGEDEPHQGSLETSLSPEIVAPSHVADRPIIVYDSDSAGLENHGVPPPPFLEGSSSSPLTLMELLDNFSTVDVENTSDKEMLDVVAKYPEFYWDWESVLLQLGLLEAQYKVAQQLRELFDTTETLYCHASAMQTYSYIFEAVSILIAPNNEFSCFQFTFNTNLHTLNYKVVYASEIGGALSNFMLQTHGLFVLREELCIGIPRCQCILGRCDKKSRMCLKEEGNWCKSVDSILENPAITNYNAVLESRLTELGEGYEQAVKACVVAMVWRYLFIKPNIVGDLLQDGFQHAMRMEAHQKPYKSLALLEFINCLIFDQDFGEKFYSWIVNIIRDMSPKELSKFHHFVVDSPEFQPREPIWIQVER